MLGYSSVFEEIVLHLRNGCMRGAQPALSQCLIPDVHTLAG